MILDATQLKQIAAEEKLSYRNKQLSDLQRINADLLVEKDH